MKIAFTALAIAAISLNAQALPTIDTTGITGTDIHINQTADKLTITGTDIRIDSTANINFPGTLLIQSTSPINYGINNPNTGCGACITAINNKPIVIHEVSTGQAIDPGFQSSIVFIQSAKIEGAGLDALTSHEAKQLNMPNLPDMNSLSPSAGATHAHPELMNLSTAIDDNTNLSASQ